MEEDRAKKIEAGREKLALFKKKKQKRGKCTPGNSTPAHSSNSSSSSLNVSLPDLPENTTGKGVEDVISDSSTISEHLRSVNSSDSVENDRSLQEIEISNNSLAIILDNLPGDDQAYRLSQENLSPINSSQKTETIVEDKVNSTIANDAVDILNEILCSECFKSRGENSNLTDTNDLSINIFEGVSLDDSSINNYVTKLRQTNLSDVNDEEFNKILTPEEVNIISEHSFERIKVLEKQLVRKDSEIAALSAELDSLKELTNSLSTTDYKPYQEDYHSRLVEFQNAVMHRDNLIQQLTESLQQSILNREELQQQSENFAKEISLLQKQLSKTSNIIKQHQCTMENVERSPAKTFKQQFRKKSNKTEDDDDVVSISLPLRRDNDNLSSIDESVVVIKGGDSCTVPVVNLEEECAKLQDTLGANQVLLLDELKIKINMYIQQKASESNKRFQEDIERLKEKLLCEKVDYESEISRLRQLLFNVKDGSVEFAEMKKELDVKHAKEMEELRTYFEKKCSDLEKNYSEEIFSQQSRKMSDSSTCSELNSDTFEACAAAAGPGGDAAPCSDAEVKQADPSKLDDLNSPTKDDITKIKEDLLKFSVRFSKINVDKLSKGELKKINSDLANSNLKLLAKYDWSEIKNDMRNKYNAELEILREDYDNRMDLLNVDYDVKMRNMKESYQEQIDVLKYELNEALRSAQMSVSTAVQEVASSGEYELAEVVQSYERRLQEQVTLAKIDIIAALEHQIQMLANGNVDSEWPSELLQIRNRFTETYAKEIEEMKTQHHQEIAQLKEEHFKVLNGALERARRRSLRDGESLITDKDLEIIRDRDNLKKTNALLRHLLSELLVHFTRCEDELNRTLVDEIAKYDADKPALLNDSTSSNNSTDDVGANVTKRVHFAPNFSDLLNIVDSTANASGGFDSRDISVDLKNELGSCLERLKSDANAILALTANVRNNAVVVDNNGRLAFHHGTDVAELEEKLSSLTRQLIVDSQVKNDLVAELEEARNFVRNLESERVSLGNHVEELLSKQQVLEKDLLEANKKITDLIEFSHKEVISEGYGQDHRNSSLGGKIGNLADLQERARMLVAEWKNGADHPLIQLVEELCREGERITDEAKKDKEDLRQQVDQPIDTLGCSSSGVMIEAADRKLRATCCFLEEQAMEREMERDESQKEIAALKEQLKEKDKDKETCELVTKEVEQLELQMREMTKLIETSEQKRDEAENERKEAVEKIWVLREIIRDLESQVETKNAVEDELRKLVVELEDVIKQQTSTVDGLNRQLEGCKGGEGDDVHLLKERIVYLENEAQKLRLNNELVGSEGALREIQLQLNQFESSIERKTKDLEGLHSTISTTSCSSPSEDMSIRDQIRPHTPTVLGECDVPLQQLARLKEKLVKHSRAEDAAVKRIRDLEMQLTSTKHELEETQNEKEILQNQVTEQIVLLSSLQMRLDEQRLKAEHNQRQANSSLEVRIYDLETEVQALKETVHCKEKTIKQLNKIVEQTKERLEDREKELSAKEEDATILKLQAEIGKLTEENRLLKSKIDSDAQNAQILPNLVDNIIADKNSDIENLRRQLLDVQKQFDEYQSLNLDLDQLKQLSQMVSSDRALSDILSLLNLSEASVAEQVRKADQPTVDSLESPADLAAYNRNTNETVFLGSRKDFFIPEISTIEKEGPLNVDYTVDGVPLIKPNSTEIIHKSGANLELERLKTELAEKDDIIREYMEKLEVLQELEKDIDQLRKNLRTTEDDLKKARETFESEKSTDEDVKKNLRIELAEKKMHLTEKERQLELSEQDNARKEQMYMGLAREKREIELKLNEARQDVEHYKNFDAIINEKNMEVYHLEEQLAKLVESCVALEDLQLKVHTKDGQLEQIKAKYKELEDELMKKNQEFESLQVRYRTQSEDNQKLKKELKNTSEQLDSLTLELNATKSELKVKMEQLAGLEMTVTANCNHDEEIKRLKSLLVDRECELEILNEDLTRYQNDLSKLEEEIKRKQSGGGEFELESIKLQKQIAERDLEILKLRTVHDDLNKEIQHLHDHLQEKDKIIEQMKADTKSLHVNLETIQNKIQETGNIVDLRKRLQDEQHLNAILREEINGLRNPQDSIGKKERSFSIEDITGQVRRQLDYSAHLDSNILQALSSGDELNADADSIKDQQPSLNDFERLRTELEQKLNYEREQNQQLRNQLEKEKTLSTTIQIEDANLIEQMRIRLEEALDGEKQLEKSLERERKQRIDLENQVVALNQKMKTNVSTSSNSKTEVTEYKSLPNLDTHEVIRLREELGCLRDQNEQLLVDLKLLKRAKNELEANLKYAKDMLQLRTDEIEKTEAKFDSMRTNELALKEELVRCQIELEQKLREVENSRELMGDLEKERHDMKRRINSLSDKLTTVEEEKRIERLVHQQKEAGLSSTVPERFLNKMKELTTSLKEQTDENKVLMETLSKMTMERSGLLERIRSLEDRNNYKVPFDDPISRANHLFGKYLRSESYRKALIWQKRYLVALLATYQDFRPIAERIPSSIFEPKQYKTPARSRGKRRFKCGAIVVIAIVRMKYMVQRWHSGRRMAAYSQQQSQNRNRTTTTTTTLADTQNNNAPSTQFQVGQPVSSQNFHSPLQEPQYGGGTFSRSPIHLLGQTTEHHVDTVHDRRSRDSPRIAGRNNVEESTAWSGVTPPQKERLRTVTSTVNIAPHSDHHLAPLETPNVMSFFKRFNDIQQRLGMTFDNLNS